VTPSIRTHGSRLPRAASFIAGGLLLGACATSATGRQQLLLLPEDELSAMGEKAFRDLKSKEPAHAEAGTNAYVDCVARAVLLGAGVNAAKWEVVVFESKEVNAFALPGGKIGVYTGLLEVANAPEQLAAVLGHEVAHVTQRHGNERVSQAFVAEGGMAAASAALGGEGAKHDLALAALGIGAEVGVLMPFGRTQESEADVIGLDYMARAGFDPQGAVALWKNMSAASGDSLPEFLSTHPSHDTRIRNLEQRLPPALVTYGDARAKGIVPRCLAIGSPRALTKM
jgi:predicted Zn-dependent protease